MLDKDEREMSGRVTDDPLSLPNNSKVAYGETPYSLAFGTEAWILIEFGLEPLHVFNLAELAQSLDELEEKREGAVIRMAEYQHRVAW